MKCLCLISYEEQMLDTLSRREVDALMAEAFTYDEVLRKSGHYLVSEALQTVRMATTVRVRNGQVSLTAGPLQTPAVRPTEAGTPGRRHAT
jgi:hypothetical protein